MKLKLTTKASSDAPPPSNAPAAPPPQDSASTPAPKVKLKFGKSAPPSGADGQTGEASKKRKYTKKATIEGGQKKRAREDGDDGDNPSGKRKSRPTAKALEDYGTDDDDEPLAQQAAPPAPRPAPLRTQSIKLSIKPKGAAPGAPQRTGTTLVKLKGAGKPPVRPPGVGYDSEADEAEIDPAIESQFILRMQPGEDCDLLRKAIEEKKVGVSVAQGGPGVQFRFFDREGRRAMVTVQGHNYAASMVELPTVIETMKSWNKKDWVKTADVCQMLLVLGRVQNEEEAKKYPRPHIIEPESHRYPHGITPPMHWARKLRFRPRKSYLDVERAEAQMNRLLVQDESAASTSYDLVDSGRESSDDESDSGAEEDEEMPNAPEMVETPVEEVDPDLLEQMLQEGLVEEDDLEIEGDAQTINAILHPEPDTEPATPATAHDVALHALQPNGAAPETETAASTPAAATSADDDDDDDDADSDEDEVDDAAVAEEQRKEQLRREIAELDEAIETSLAGLAKHNNKLYKQRVQTTIDKQKADREIKRKQLGEGADMDE